jgi:hypothetical protein
VRELNAFDNLYFEIQNEPWAEGKDTVITWNDYISPSDLKVPGNHWKNTLEIASQASLDWHETVSGWISQRREPAAEKAFDRTQHRQFPTANTSF